MTTVALGAEILLETSQKLATATNENDLLQILSAPIIETEADRADLFFMDVDEKGEPEWIELVANWNKQESQTAAQAAFPVGTRIYLPELPFAKLWTSSPDKPQIMPDIANDPKLDEQTRGLMLQSGNKAMVIISLYRPGHWIGLVSIGWNAPHEFSDDEVEIISSLSTIATAAIENHRLLKNLTKVIDEQKSTETQLREQLDYILEQNKLISRQRSAIAELSTPVLQVWESVLVLPVIGVVDTTRSADIMERLLDEVSTKNARYVIMDITGVEIVDTRTADHFIKMIRASQLLGSTCIITGIRPAVAQTLVEIGIDLTSISTLRTLQDGLRFCIGRMNKEKI